MPLPRRMSTRAQDVAGRQRDVLAAGAVVELEVLVDLRLLLRDRRLVERELHPVVAGLRDDLAHQGGVNGGDVVTDELRHVREAHDPVVELHPLSMWPSSTLTTTWSTSLNSRLGDPATAAVVFGCDVAGI